MTVTRRELAKGTMWATPVILATAAAPAMAASPCAVYRRDQPLPASAFTVTYLNIDRDIEGGLLTRKVGINFGFRISDQARTCGLTEGSITSYNNGGDSGVRMENGNTYRTTNDLSVPANGTVGSIDYSCNLGQNGTQACGTSGASRYNVHDSTHTSGIAITGMSIYRLVHVSGYADTVIYLNASQFTGSSNDNRTGSVFSVTSTRLF